MIGCSVQRIATVLHVKSREFSSLTVSILELRVVIGISARVFHGLECWLVCIKGCD